MKLREAGYGRVLVTTSNAGILGNFGQSNYGAAKMGLVGLARVLAQEGARHNIKVNALAPIARTRMTEELLGPLAPKLDPAWSPRGRLAGPRGVPGHGRDLLGRRRVARFFVGLTGYANPALTPRTSATTSTRSATRPATRSPPGRRRALLAGRAPPVADLVHRDPEDLAGRSVPSTTHPAIS